MAFTMATRTRFALLAPLACLCIAAATLESQEPAGAARAAAARWLDALDATQRAACLHALDSDARLDWHYTPRKRPGVRIGGLTEMQRERLKELLGSVFDDAALHKLEQIRELERVLFELESRPGAAASWRDADDYHVAVFGDPREQERWSWRFEGHHISLTVAGIGETVVGVTPQFLGANPARAVTGSGAGVRVLEREEELARELLGSLDEAQRAKAVVAAELSGDIHSTPGQSVVAAGKLGLGARDMNEDQRALVRGLVELFAGRLRLPFGDPRSARLFDGLEAARFVWIGSGEPGERCYWRLHVASSVFEFDNSQPGANHVHTLWRDADSDFGGAALEASPVEVR
jgi:hypothetical protein